MYDDDQALEDEEDLGLDSPRTPKPRASGQEEPTDEGEEDEYNMDDEAPPPCRLSITVEKPGKSAGALSIDATARDGAITIDNVQFFEDAALALARTADVTHARIDDIPPNHVHIAWDAARRSPLIREFVAIAIDQADQPGGGIR